MNRAPERENSRLGALPISIESRPRVMPHRFTLHVARFALRHFAEKRYTVVVLYVSPGRRIVDGKFGLFGESG